MGREFDHSDHQGDSGGIIHACLALKSRPGATADFAPTEHREHHGGIGGCQRGTEQAGQCPVHAEDEMGEGGDRARQSRNVPTKPSDRTGTSEARRRRIPISMPPLKRMMMSATTAMRSTVRIGTWA